jgi:hypothetical protein
VTATASIQRTEGRRAAAGLLLALLGLGLAAGLAYGKQERGKQVQLITEISLSQRIFSSPVLWRPAGPGAFAVAVVTGGPGAEGEPFTAVDAYGADGQRLPGFPKLRSAPYEVAPANQVAALPPAGGDGEGLLVVGLDGRLRLFSPEHPEPVISPAGDEVHGMLVTPPLPLPDPAGGAPRLALLSHDFRPRSEGRDALDLLDLEGRSLPGFPLRLAAAPEAQPPLLDAPQGRLFLLGGAGEVLAFGPDGASLAGFPTPPLVAIRPDVGLRLAMTGQGETLWASRGDASLSRIDPQGGGLGLVPVPQAQRLTGLAGVGARLYAVDEGPGLLLRLDPQGQPQASLPLGLAPGSRNHWLGALPARGGEATWLVLVSSTEADPDERIEALFDLQAPPAAKERLQQRLAQDAQRQFQTQEPTQAQREELRQGAVMMKKSYLRKHLGDERMTELLGLEAVTHIQAVLDDGTKMRLVLQEQVRRFTPKTGFSFAPLALPVLRTEANGEAAILAVPLNYSEPAADPAEENQSLLRLYRLPL